jgi:hypothetical protein
LIFTAIRLTERKIKILSIYYLNFIRQRNAHVTLQLLTIKKEKSVPHRSWHWHLKPKITPGISGYILI